MLKRHYPIYPNHHTHKTILLQMLNTDKEYSSHEAYIDYNPLQDLFQGKTHCKSEEPTTSEGNDIGQYRYHLVYLLTACLYSLFTIHVEPSAVKRICCLYTMAR